MAMITAKTMRYHIQPQPWLKTQATTMNTLPHIASIGSILYAIARSAWHVFCQILIYSLRFLTFIHLRAPTLPYFRLLVVLLYLVRHPNS